MGKPRRKGKRAETPSASGPQGKCRLQQVKKPVKSSVFKRNKKGPSPGQQKGSRVTRAGKQEEPYDNHFQACMNEGSPDVVAGFRDNGGIASDLSTVPVKIEEWKGKSEPQGLGNEFSDDGDGGIVVDIPPIGEIKEERMSDDEVVTEEGLGDLIVDDVSEDEEPISGSAVNQVGIGSGSGSEGFDVLSANEVNVGEMSGSIISPVSITEGDTMIDVFESVEEENVNDDLIDKASNAAMEVDEANQDTEATAVNSITPEVIAQALPHVFKQLERKELLNCRVVCKEWCETVNFYLENRPVYYPYRHDVTKETNLRSVWEEDLASSDKLPVTRFPMATTSVDIGAEFYELRNYPIDKSRVTLEPKNLLCTRFQTVASLSDFRKEFEKSPGNPFVGRLVSLEPAKFGAPEYWKEAKEMASKLGKHIWILKIYTRGNDTWNFDEFYKGVQQFLQMVPELKYLEIEHDKGGDMHSTYTYTDMKIFFLNIVNQKPLPNLPQLQTLVLPRRLHVGLKTALLQRYGAQVGKLVSDLNYFGYDYNADLNLSELGIIHVSTFKSLSDIVFEPLQGVNLQKLELHFTTQDCLPVNQLFKGLPLFNSLKAVSVSFVPYCCQITTCKGCEDCSKYLPATLNRNSSKAPPPMILPSVESFKLATISPCLTFQFLKSLPQLKYLHLKCEVGHLLGITEIEEEKDIGVELKNLVYGKNTQLWKLLPTLKQVKINDRMEYNRPLVMRSKNPWISSFDEVIPHLFCEFEYTDLTKVIQVCPAWKGAVENCIDNQRIERTFTFSSFKQAQLTRHSGLHNPKSIPCTTFATPHYLNEFKKYASKNESEINPFWLRSISLARTYHCSDEFWNAVEDFLKTFGHRVWFLSLKLTTEDKLLLNKNLHRCFQHLPNLKSLEFYTNFQEELDEAAEKESQFFKENPLPTMEHLDTLCFSGNISHARKTVKALLMKYSGQLKRLDISSEIWPINFGDLPKLVHLKLEIEVGHKELPTVLWSLKAPKLRHLDLCLSRSIDHRFLFKLLEPFQLCSLCLYFMQIRKRSECSINLRTCPTYLDFILISPSDISNYIGYHYQVAIPIITLPSVEHLYVRLCHDKQSFRFLRCFPSLKYLQLEKTTDARPDDDVGVELMQCKNGREAAKQSKIWDMLPQVKGIQLIAKGSTFVDRAGYYKISKRPIAKEEETEESEEEKI